MNDSELLRYSRHILLDAIDIEGQERIRAAHVLVVGAGGLGCAASLYLAASGVGTLTIVDHDTVDLTNLQRQVAHTTSHVGMPKVVSLAVALNALNPEVRVMGVAEKADAQWLDSHVPQADVVLDCTDNFATRQDVNRACVRHRRPLVSGAALRFDGQVATYDTRHAAGACYACVFPPQSQVEEANCATMGVFSPLVGIIGTTQAADALLLMLAIGRADDRLRMLDARLMEWSHVRMARDPVCPVCAGRSER